MNGIARLCSIAVLATLVLAPAAQAQLADAGFDDLARVASATGSRSDTAPACEVSGAQLHDRLGLLWTAISRARALIWEACQDSNKLHFLNHGYRPYEGVSNDDGHLLAVGHLLVNSSPGRAPAKRRVHDFSFDRELLERLEDPMVYLRSFRAKTSPVYDRLLALYALRRGHDPRGISAARESLCLTQGVPGPEDSAGRRRRSSTSRVVQRPGKLEGGLTTGRP